MSNDDRKLAFILSIILVLSIGYGINKDKKVKETQNRFDVLYDDYSERVESYWDLREKLAYYEYISDSRFNASDVKVITGYYDSKEQISLATIGRSRSFEVTSYEDLFVDTPTIPYKGITFDYEDMKVSLNTNVGMPVLIDKTIYSKSDDGVFSGFYHEIRFAGTDDYILKEREIYKYGKIIESLSYRKIEGKEIESLSSILRVKEDDKFSINELQIMEEMLNEEKGLKLEIC